MVVPQRQTSVHAVSQVARCRRAFQNAERLGLLRAVLIIPSESNHCPAAGAQAGIEYSLASLPRLPLPGCTRRKCECNYAAVATATLTNLIRRPPTRFKGSRRIPT